MIPLACDNRLTRQPPQGILHGLMQRSVKAPHAAFGRGETAAPGRHLKPGQPAGDPATLGGVQYRQRRPCGEAGLARSALSALEPEGERALGEAVSWAE